MFHSSECRQVKLFDAIYVINLAHRADRREEMRAQLRRLKLQLDAPPVILFDAIRPSDQGAFPSIGARGCFLSHLGVLEHAVQGGFQTVLILEDDCNFTETCAGQLEQLLSPSCLARWDIAYGGALNKDFLVSPVDGFWQVPPTQELMGGHFIAIHGRALPALVSYLRAILTRPAGDPLGGPMHVDGAYSWFRKQHPQLITLLATPQIAFQRSSRTDIHPNRWFDRWPIVRDVVALIRKFRNR